MKASMGVCKDEAAGATPNEGASQMGLELCRKLDEGV